MKTIRYRVKWLTQAVDPETGLEEQRELLVGVEKPYSQAEEELAKQQAHNGEYTVEDISAGSDEPTQLDRVEAQVFYTAMMTDTLLEVTA